MSDIRESVQVFRADSINGGSGSGGEFGRFVPATGSDSIRLIQDTLRRWHIGLPYGSTQWCGNCGKRETRERFDSIVASVNSAEGYSRFRWRTDKTTVDAESRIDAAKRHNSCCGRDTYVTKFSGPVSV